MTGEVLCTPNKDLPQRIHCGCLPLLPVPSGTELAMLEIPSTCSDFHDNKVTMFAEVLGPGLTTRESKAALQILTVILLPWSFCCYLTNLQHSSCHCLSSLSEKEPVRTPTISPLLATRK
jgi:hypothetical protein